MYVATDKNFQKILNYQYLIFFFIFLLACQNGFYGEGCSEMCNDTCTGCNNINGSCDSGCLQGWKGGFCHIGRVQQLILMSYMNICIRFIFIYIISLQLNFCHVGRMYISHIDCSILQILKLTVIYYIEMYYLCTIHPFGKFFKKIFTDLFDKMDLFKNSIKMIAE